MLESVKTGKKPVDWTGTALAAFASEFKPEMARLLDPAEGMRSRELPGGTGPKTVAEALKQAANRLAAMRAALPAS